MRDGGHRGRAFPGVRGLSPCITSRGSAPLLCLERDEGSLDMQQGHTASAGASGHSATVGGT